MKRLLTLGLLLGLIAPALAQGVNTNPQVGVNTANLRQPTYSAVSISLVPAASATDIFCIAGSATKDILIRYISVSGSAGTLVTVPITLLRRATLDTGGTAATGAALPVGVGNNANNATASAVLVAYTTNPTINDSSPVYLRTGNVTLPVTSAGTVTMPLIWQFGTAQDAYNQGLAIPRGTPTTQYCLNLNATSVTSGLLQISAEWNEN